MTVMSTFPLLYRWYQLPFGIPAPCRRHLITYKPPVIQSRAVSLVHLSPITSANIHCMARIIWTCRLSKYHRVSRHSVLLHMK